MFKSFLYDIDTGQYTEISVPEAEVTALRDINEAGVLVGWTEGTGGAVGLLATPAP